MPVVLTIPKDSEVPNILENPERWQRVQCVFPHSHDGDFILSFWQRLSPKNDYFFSFSYPCSGIGTLYRRVSPCTSGYGLCSLVRAHSGNFSPVAQFSDDQ